jgi:hypothetical protein
MQTPNHMFHGYATGFGARIEKPFWRQVTEASAALPPSGGHAAVVSHDFHLEDLFEFEEASIDVLGHYYFGERTAEGVRTTAETRVSASVTALAVPGVLSIDRISLILVSERDFFPDGERRYRIEDARIEGLRVQDSDFNGSRPFAFDARDPARRLAPLCFGAGATGNQLRELWSRIPQDPAVAKAGLASAKGMQGVYLSYSAAENDCVRSDPRCPAFTVRKGDTTYQGFLFELLHRDGLIDVNLFRLEISSNPSGGSGSGGSGGVNGNPSV